MKHLHVVTQAFLIKATSSDGQNIVRFQIEKTESSRSNYWESDRINQGTHVITILLEFSLHPTRKSITQRLPVSLDNIYVIRKN